MITLQQIRAARAMLGLKQQELARKASISTGTLNNIERGVQTDPKLSTLRAIRKALEFEGIEFTEGETGDIGIRLKALFRGGDSIPVLIIDDSHSDRALYKAWLNGAADKKYTLIEADNAAKGYDAFLKHKPACIILDFMMYGTTGFQLLAQMKNEPIVIPPIIFVTAIHDDTLEQKVMALGANTYLDKKTLTKERLQKAVAQALAHSLSSVTCIS